MTINCQSRSDELTITNKTLIQDDVIVVQDTRESNPLSLFPFTKIIRKCLKTADYSLEGAEHLVAIELKELGDFVKCCTYDRERFEAELYRMREYEYKAIVIKSTWSAIERKSYRGATSPLAVLGSAMAFAMTANVSIIMAEDHQTAGRLVARLLWIAANRIHRKKSQISVD